MDEYIYVSGASARELKSNLVFYIPEDHLDTPLGDFIGGVPEWLVESDLDHILLGTARDCTPEGFGKDDVLILVLGDGGLATLSDENGYFVEQSCELQEDGDLLVGWLKDVPHKLFRLSII